jgi:hypothetical protein
MLMEVPAVDKKLLRLSLMMFLLNPVKWFVSE